MRVAALILALLLGLLAEGAAAQEQPARPGFAHIAPAADKQIFLSVVAQSRLPAEHRATRSIVVIRLL